MQRTSQMKKVMKYSMFPIFFIYIISLLIILTIPPFSLPYLGSPQCPRGSAGTCIRPMLPMSTAYSRDAVSTSANLRACRPTKQWYKIL